MTGCLASNQIAPGLGGRDNFIALVMPMHHEAFVDGSEDLGKLNGLDGVRDRNGNRKIL
jgi:hypothetical protein